MSAILGAIGIVAWIVVPCVCGVFAALAFDEEHFVKAWSWVSVGAVVVIGGIALVLYAGERSRLCARGHETYQLIGKTMQRVWVCDEEQP